MLIYIKLARARTRPYVLPERERLWRPTPSLGTFGLRIQEEYVVVVSVTAGKETSNGNALQAVSVVVLVPAAAGGSVVFGFLAALFSSTLVAKRKHEKSLNPPIPTTEKLRFVGCRLVLALVVPYVRYLSIGERGYMCI
jgi:hypothetical protein